MNHIHILLPQQGPWMSISFSRRCSHWLDQKQRPSLAVGHNQTYMFPIHDLIQLHLLIKTRIIFCWEKNLTKLPFILESKWSILLFVRDKWHREGNDGHFFTHLNMDIIHSKLVVIKLVNDNWEEQDGQRRLWIVYYRETHSSLPYSSCCSGAWRNAYTLVAWGWGLGWTIVNECETLFCSQTRFHACNEKHVPTQRFLQRNIAGRVVQFVGRRHKNNCTLDYDIIPRTFRSVQRKQKRVYHGWYSSKKLTCIEPPFRVAGHVKVWTTFTTISSVFLLAAMMVGKL